MATLTHSERFARRRAIAAYVAAGNSTQQAAVHFGVGLPTVRNACNEFRTEYPRENGNSIQIPPLKVVVEIVKGKADSDIAKQFGLSRQRVYQVRKKVAESGLLKVCAKSGK
jgi:transposase